MIILLPPSGRIQALIVRAQSPLFLKAARGITHSTDRGDDSGAVLTLETIVAVYRCTSDLDFDFDLDLDFDSKKAGAVAVAVADEDPEPAFLESSVL